MSSYKTLEVNYFDSAEQDWFLSPLLIESPTLVKLASNISYRNEIVNGDVFNLLRASIDKNLLNQFMTSYIKEGKIIKRTTKLSKANVVVHEHGYTDYTDLKNSHVAIKYLIKNKDELYSLNSLFLYYDIEVPNGLLPITEFHRKNEITTNYKEAIKKLIEIAGDQHPELFEGDFTMVEIFNTNIKDNILNILASFVDAELSDRKIVFISTEDLLKQIYDIKEEPVPRALFFKIKRYLENSNTRSVGVSLLLKYSPIINEFVFRYFKEHFYYGLSLSYPYLHTVRNLPTDINLSNPYSNEVVLQDYQLDIIESESQKLLAIIKEEYLLPVRIDRQAVLSQYPASNIAKEHTDKYFVNDRQQDD